MPGDYYVHDSSFVEKGVKIGKGTRIWYYCHVREGAVIGEKCNIGQNVYVGKDVRIGNGCKIQNNVSVYEGVELEDYVFCGPSMVFTNVINPRSEIERKAEIERTLVRRGATIGANATILCGITIGEYAFIGAGAVLTKDVPAYGLCVGNPARLEGWMCKCGVQIKFEDGEAVCSACGAKYIKEGEKVRAKG